MLITIINHIHHHHHHHHIIMIIIENSLIFIIITHVTKAINFISLPIVCIRQNKIVEKCCDCKFFSYNHHHHCMIFCHNHHPHYMLCCHNHHPHSMLPGIQTHSTQEIFDWTISSLRKKYEVSIGHNIIIIIITDLKSNVNSGNPH